MFTEVPLGLYLERFGSNSKLLIDYSTLFLSTIGFSVKKRANWFLLLTLIMSASGKLSKVMWLKVLQFKKRLQDVINLLT
jgi:hypothetical protein